MLLLTFKLIVTLGAVVVSGLVFNASLHAVRLLRSIRELKNTLSTTSTDLLAPEIAEIITPRLRGVLSPQYSRTIKVQVGIWWTSSVLVWGAVAFVWFAGS